MVKNIVEYGDNNITAPNSTDTVIDYALTCLGITSVLTNNYELRVIYLASIIPYFYYNWYHVKKEYNTICNYFFKTKSQNIEKKSDKSFFKKRILYFSSKYMKLPNCNFDDYKVADFEDLEDYDTQQKLLCFFDKKLVGSDYLETVKQIEKLDSRIKFQIINKKMSSAPFLPTNSFIISVFVYDKAWLGYPTLNTMIVEINDGSIHKFKYISDYY